MDKAINEWLLKYEKIKEIRQCSILTGIPIIFDLSIGLESDLRHVVTSIIAKQ